MRKRMAKINCLLLALSGSMLFSVSFCSAQAVQNPADPKNIIIDSFQIHGLPLTLSNIPLAKIESGYRLRLSAWNTSNEQILGVRYWLVIVNSANKVRASFDKSENLKLDPYTTREVSFPAASRLKIGNDDHVFLVLAQVIGRESIWEVSKAKETLETYLKGDGFMMPSVSQFPNQVDAPPQPPPVLRIP